MVGGLAKKTGKYKGREGVQEKGGGRGRAEYSRVFEALQRFLPDACTLSRALRLARAESIGGERICGLR